LKDWRRGFFKWVILREGEEELICDDTNVEEEPTWLSEAEAEAAAAMARIT
jgi:hypothetical protein